MGIIAYRMERYLSFRNDATMDELTTTLAKAKLVQSDDDEEDDEEDDDEEDDEEDDDEEDDEEDDDEENDEEDDDEEDDEDDDEEDEEDNEDEENGDDAVDDVIDEESDDDEFYVTKEEMKMVNMLRATMAYENARVETADDRLMLRLLRETTARWLRETNEEVASSSNM
jgi:hypothetical protein